MYSKCKERGLHVRKEDTRLILSTLDPLGTEMRRKRRLHRRAYFSKGPNFIWHVDSYDKLKPFGICINGAIDGFARRILWLNAYCTSSDPQVIGGYFLETVRSLGGCPRIHMGTENSTIRDMQRYLRRSDDDPLAGERSFIYGKSTANQRIESWWGILRKECDLNIFTKLKMKANLMAAGWTRTFFILFPGLDPGNYIAISYSQRECKIQGKGKFRPATEHQQAWLLPATILSFIIFFFLSLAVNGTPDSRAQLKKRGESDNQTDGPSPSQLSRSPKSPFLPRAARVLPPAGGKENGEESSPQWLKELKTKKRLSQYEGDSTA
ncbi:hypothetical protein F2P79_021986 [Pimephales promelas]|nr:hypothetical protein F2P79_021986 [Pimephales promelas]